MPFVCANVNASLIRRRIAVRLLAGLVLLGCGLSARAADKPNLVVFLVDDMGVMDTSVPMLTDGEGNPVRHPLNDWYRTPNMARLAATGIRFSDFYAQTTCSPSRISILTGRNAARHGTTLWIRPDAKNTGRFGPPDWNWTGLKASDVTLPGVLRRAGYRTIHIGKGHLGPSGSEGAEPLNLGFDANVGGCAIGQPGSYYGTEDFGNRLPQQKSHAVPNLERYYGQDIFLTEALTREANRLVAEAVRDDHPFFLYLAHYAVHAPFMADPRFVDHYHHAGKSGAAENFAALIEGMDTSLGDVLDQLEALGVAEDTFIVFLGDNGSDAPLGPAKGYSSSAPLRGKKGTEYEGGTRVTFIASWGKPNPQNPWQQRLPVAAGAIQSELGTIDDIFPTLVALADAEVPDGYVVDGFDLSPQLAGRRNPDRSESFLMHMPHEHNSRYITTFRLGDWKVIYHYHPQTPRAPGYQLFNLADDPFEAHDLAAGRPKELTAIVAAMAGQLEARGARYPVDTDGYVLYPVVP